MYIVHEGQAELHHYCDKCMCTYWKSDGTVHKMQVIITDSLSMGQPCCNIFCCHNPLSMNHSCFCEHHLSLGFDKICAVDWCNAPVISGSRACGDPAHQQMEHLHNNKMSAIFQLAQGLQHNHATQPNNSMIAQQLAEVLNLKFKDEWYQLDPTTQQVKLHTLNNPVSTGILNPNSGTKQDGCDGKSDQGNQKLQAKLG